MNTIRRVAWIDNAKGIGIFLVVLGHVLPEQNLIATIIWTFHMPLFFFLSGLTARPWTASSFGSFSRSLKSLAVPYLFFSVLSITLWQALHGNLTSLTSWLAMAEQMVYGVAGPDRKMPYNVPLWFFTCLFSIRILFALITAFLSDLRTTLIAAIGIALFAHTVVFVHFRSLIWNLDAAFVGLLFYTAGFIISQSVLRSKIEPPVPTGQTGTAWLTLSVALMLTVAVANGRVDMNGRAFGNYPLFYLGAFAGIYVTIALSCMVENYRWVGVIGQASIVIFPVHTLWAMLPFRIVPTITWYGYRLTHSEVGGALIASGIEILLCMPLYLACMRWAPQLIGLSTTKVNTINAPQYVPPRN